MTKRPLRYVISSALLVGSLGACGASEHTINEAPPEVNEAEEAEVNDPEPNEQGHAEGEPGSVDENPEPEPEVFTNEILAEPME